MMLWQAQDLQGRLVWVLRTRSMKQAYGVGKHCKLRAGGSDTHPWVAGSTGQWGLRSEMQLVDEPQTAWGTSSEGR